jgi:hypothetical protein
MAPTATQNPFSTLFSGNEPKDKQIQWAVSLLREMLDRPESPRAADLWARLLAIFPGDQLADAFNVVAMTSKGWPTPSDITEPIFEQEYTADFKWLLTELGIHGANWQDRPPVYAEMWRKPGAGIDQWEPGDLKEPAILAPRISERLLQALTIVGGSWKGGLAFLQRHPAFWSPRYAGDEAMRTKAQIEREFKAAWMQARKRELGGAR